MLLYVDPQSGFQAKLTSFACCLCFLVPVQFDAARAFINQVQDLNPQTPVTTASAGAKPDVAAVQLANAMLDNAGAFISSPGTDASPPFLQVAITLNNNLSKRLLTKALALLVKNGTMTVSAWSDHAACAGHMCLSASMITALQALPARPSSLTSACTFSAQP